MSSKKKNHKSRIKSALKKVKLSADLLKKKKEEKLKEEKTPEDKIQEKKEEKVNEEKSNQQKENGFHENILEEDIGFVAPVITSQQAQQSPIQGFSLESTAAEFSTQPSGLSSDTSINYTGKKAAGDYSGSANYLLKDDQRYSNDVSSFTPLGMGIADNPMNQNRNALKKTDVFNPFSEERNTRSDKNWGSQQGELEEFTQLQQQEQIEKEKKKRQSSQFA
ncbi:hypothetical protein FJZ17_03265 [Candidatus Pacearchaeota archaeon]|nr:hypothetical protein [Candidatus Pacearchaeota archaeon]